MGSEARKDSKLRCGLVPAGGQKMVPRGERAALAGPALAGGGDGAVWGGHLHPSSQPGGRSCQGEKSLVGSPGRMLSQLG